MNELVRHVSALFAEGTVDETPALFELIDIAAWYEGRPAGCAGESGRSTDDRVDR